MQSVQDAIPEAFLRVLGGLGRSLASFKRTVGKTKRHKLQKRAY